MHSMYSSSCSGHFDISHDNIRPGELCAHRVKVLPEVASGDYPITQSKNVHDSNQPCDRSKQPLVPVARLPSCNNGMRRLSVVSAPQLTQTH